MQNGRLDVSTLVDWDGYQNYLTPEAARQWIGARNAYAAATGYWLFTSECYRPVGNPGDLDRGTINTQWYWKEWWTRAGKPGNAAAPGTNSTHGWAKGIDLLNWPEREQLVPTMAAYGWSFNVAGEPWHMSYIGNPAIIASNNTTQEDSLSAAEVNALADRIEDATRPFTIYQDDTKGVLYLGGPGIWWHIPDPGYLGILRDVLKIAKRETIFTGQHREFFDFAGYTFLSQGNANRDAILAQLEALKPAMSKAIAASA